VRVHGIGAKLWGEADKQNYGHLHVTFDDGSVGWYEAGWGPMMSEVAFFVKDVVGPEGCVSIVVPQDGEGAAKDGKVSDSADIDQHTKTNALRIHHAAVNADKSFAKPDEIMRMDEEPGHQDLCDREQELFLRAIRDDLDLTESMEAAVNSLRIVLAAEESIEKGEAIHLA
jgi:predicted dehydrogenase